VANHTIEGIILRIINVLYEFIGLHRFVQREEERNMKRSRINLLPFFVLPVLPVLPVLALIMVACSGNTNVAEEPVVEEIVEVVEVVEEEPPVIQADTLIPYIEDWETSGHANFDAEAFRHWDGDEEKVVPASCAKCHSEFGFRDFVGADGSEAGVVDADAELGSVVSCITCHNDATSEMTSVTMPSGVEITGLGSEARCMTCHQGRSSGVALDEKFVELGVEADLDTVNEELGFVNIHYYAAAATKYGTVAKGGYEYAGKTYDSYFAHVDDYQTCADCHDTHTLEIKVNECEECHGFSTAEEYKDVRMAGSLVDYDGDGDISEGIYYEIETLQEMLYSALQAYSADVIGSGLVYDSHSYPYFFADTDGDGMGGEAEINYGNKYATWTPRLVKAAYNYQLSLKDTGAFAHGGKYVIELLYDSIEDLNTGIDISMANRIDHGHFAGSTEAFRHWDEDGEVSASCSKCHSAEGLPLFLKEGVTITQEVSNGFQCTTCHSDTTDYARYEVADVTFPSGATVASEDPNTNLCMNCHQGRATGNALDKNFTSLGDDEVGSLRFSNIHYFPAGATLYGAEVNGGYQYAGKDYVGRNEHVSKADECTDCHDAHILEVKVDTCANCHEVETLGDLAGIRGEDSVTDYDGNGELEGFGIELAAVADVLYAKMLEYSVNKAGTALVYDSHAYPYFFTDLNANGVSDPGEAIYPNAYSTWTPSLLKAAYNYQYFQKDPGAFAHNGQYMLQLLIDGIADLGGSTSGITRP
jgi:hypothetical protein